MGSGSLELLQFLKREATEIRARIVKKRKVSHILMKIQRTRGNNKLPCRCFVDDVQFNSHSLLLSGGLHPSMAELRKEEEIRKHQTLLGAHHFRRHSG